MNVGAENASVLVSENVCGSYGIRNITVNVTA